MNRNWEEEMQSAYLYRVLSVREKDEARRRLFEGLARAAESQAKIWADGATHKDEKVTPAYRPGIRPRIVAGLIRLFGPERILPVLAAMKVRGLVVYRGHAMPTEDSPAEDRHRIPGRSGNLRATVFGAGDGLVSNSSLIFGMAGATGDPHLILITGVAGLLAGALSMAAGEYISVRSQRELYEYQIELEAEELQKYPAEEAEELALIYIAKGMAAEQARALSKKIISNPEHALDTLSKEELGLNPAELGYPFSAALASLCSFSLGALIPLIPYFFTPGPSAVWVSGAVTGTALFGIGVVLSLFTGRPALWSGGRMLLIGSAAGAATYLAGHLLGVQAP